MAEFLWADDRFGHPSGLRLSETGLRASFFPLVQQLEFLKLSHDTFFPTRPNTIKS